MRNHSLYLKYSIIFHVIELILTVCTNDLHLATKWGTYKRWHSFVSVRPSKPTLTASVTNSTIKTKTKLTLTCSTSSQGISSNSISYTFLKNNKTISPPPPPGSQYTVNTSHASDKTSYTCKVDINGVSSLSSLEHSVRVVGEFTWSLFLSEIIVFFYLSVLFLQTCNAYTL